MTNKFGNTKKKTFIESRPISSIETSGIEKRCKFNFSYFDAYQDAGQSFEDWDAETGLCCLSSLMNKIKEYTNFPLTYWLHQRAGGGGLKVLAHYGDFPTNSDFTHPPHVPHDVEWCRFRLGQAVRLIGFVVPNSLSGKEITHNGKTHFLDGNTFYVVFLDKDHRFYKSEKR